MNEIKLQYPLKNLWITQLFGANALPYYQANGMLGHNGIDYGCADGTPVYAAHEGLAYIGIDSSGGNGVSIESENKYDYQGGKYKIKTIYWHLKENNPCVKWGQRVSSGDLIGYADNTGYSTGSHLHFALKPIDGVAPVNYNNGYHGAIDPMPYFNGVYPGTPFVFTKLLKIGMWNAEVLELQKVLQKLNLYTGVLDGQFGKLTKAAVIKYQKSKWLFPDGIVGPKTRAVLNK